VAGHSVVIRNPAVRELDSIDALPVRQRLADAVSRLASAPSPAGCQKLAGSIDHYRIRIGRFRIVYAIDDVARSITVLAIGDRKDVYR
jgi:mRNA interferase RelE/StbE